jgi:coproporphyrinogen III oxidase-like Fe-S oxidoreductase
MKSLLDEIELFQSRLEHDPELKEAAMKPEGLMKKLREWESYNLLKLDTAHELGFNLRSFLESLERVKEPNALSEEQDIAAALKKSFYSTDNN